MQLHGQVFFKSEIFDGPTTVKGKYFNGSGGREYWDIKSVDSLGRIVNEQSYKKNKLLSEIKNIYDSSDNELMAISICDINNPDTIDAIIMQKYSYDGAEIRKEVVKYSDNDSAMIKLVENVNDLVFIYEEMSYHSRG